VNPTVPVACPRELRKSAAAVHGGVAAWVVAGEALPAMAWRVEMLGSIRDAMRCLCVRKEGRR
jgi:hypothetical protein